MGPEPPHPVAQHPNPETRAASSCRAGTKVQPQGSWSLRAMVASPGGASRMEARIGASAPLPQERQDSIEAPLSYLGDRPAGPSKDGRPERARTRQSPAGVNLQGPSSISPGGLALPSSANPSGHLAHLPSLRSSPSELLEPSVCPYPPCRSPAPLSWGHWAGTGPRPKPRLPPHALPMAPWGRTVPRRVGRGPAAPTSSSAFSVPFSGGSRPPRRGCPSL